MTISLDRAAKRKSPAVAKLVWMACSSVIDALPTQDMAESLATNTAKTMLMKRIDMEDIIVTTSMTNDTEV